MTVQPPIPAPPPAPAAPSASARHRGATARARSGDGPGGAPRIDRAPRAGRGPAGGAGPWCCDRCRRTVTPPSADGQRLGDPEEVAGLVVPLIGGADREHCVAVLLDTKHRILTTLTVSIGSLDHTFMAPREIFRDALLANAAAVVLAHNHPSGDPEPSRDDERVTRRLGEAGRVLGVEVLDHLVVGGGRWVSLARRGAL